MVTKVKIDPDYAFKRGLSRDRMGEKLIFRKIGSFARSKDAIIEVNGRLFIIPKEKYQEISKNK